MYVYLSNGINYTVKLSRSFRQDRWRRSLFLHHISHKIHSFMTVPLQNFKMVYRLLKINPVINPQYHQKLKELRLDDQID